MAELPTPAPAQQPEWEYDVFICYSRRDRAPAVWLASKLEHIGRPIFRLPRVGRPTVRVCRDEDSFSAGPVKAEIRRRLLASHKLVVIASPAAAESEWVDSEIETFVRDRGSSAHVIPVLVRGDLPWLHGSAPWSWSAGSSIGARAFAQFDPADPPNVQLLSRRPWLARLRGLFTGEVDPAWSVVATLASSAIGVPKETLYGRQLKAVHRSVAFIAAVVVALVAALSLAMLLAAREAESRRRAAEAEMQSAQARLEAQRQAARRSATSAGALTARPGLEHDAVAQALAAARDGAEAGIASEPAFLSALQETLTAFSRARVLPRRVPHAEGTRAIWYGPGEALHAIQDDRVVSWPDPGVRELPKGAQIAVAESGALAVVDRTKVQIGTPDDPGPAFAIGDPGPLPTLLVSPDGSTAFVASDDRVQAVRRGEGLVYTLAWRSPHAATVVSRDGRRLVFLRGRVPWVWAIGSRRTVPLQAAAEPSHLLAIDDEYGILLGKSRDALYAWDLRSGKRIRTWQIPSVPGTRFCLSEEGIRELDPSRAPRTELGRAARELLSSEVKERSLGPEGGPLRTKDTCRLPSGEYGWVQVGATELEASFSPDLRFLAIGDSSGRILVMNARTGERWTELVGHVGAITALAWIADRRLLVSGGRDGSTKVWAVDVPPTLLHDLRGLPGGVDRLAVDPEGHQIAATSGPVIRTWRPASLLGDRTAQVPRLVAAARTPDGLLALATDHVELLDDELRRVAIAPLDPAPTGGKPEWELRDDGVALVRSGASAALWRDRRLTRVSPARADGTARRVMAMHLSGSSDELVCTWDDGAVTIHDLHGAEVDRVGAPGRFASAWGVGHGRFVVVATAEGASIFDRKFREVTAISRAARTPPVRVRELPGDGFLADYAREPPEVRDAANGGLRIDVEGELAGNRPSKSFGEALVGAFFESLLGSSGPGPKDVDPPFPSRTLVFKSSEGGLVAARLDDAQPVLRPLPPEWIAPHMAATASGDRVVGWMESGKLQVVDWSGAAWGSSFTLDVGSFSGGPGGGANGANASSGVAFIQDERHVVAWASDGTVARIPLGLDGAIAWACALVREAPGIAPDRLGCPEPAAPPGAGR